jgi:arylsulfatase
VHRLRRRRPGQHHLPAPLRVTGGRIVKVVFDVADDAYIDVERHFAAAMARD